MKPPTKQHPAGRPGAGHTKAGEVYGGFRYPIIHEPNFELERMRRVAAFCEDRGPDVDLFPQPAQTITPFQMWDRLERAFESSRNPIRWTFRDQIKRCKRVSAASVEAGNGFSHWFWLNVPQLFHYVAAEEAPGIAACLLDACGNYSDRARPIYRLHRKSGFKWTEADQRILIHATGLVIAWAIGELSEAERDEFDALGVRHGRA